MPKAIRNREIEEAVWRHSFFDCYLNKLARDFFLKKNNSVAASDHSSRLARSDENILFNNTPRFAKKYRPVLGQRRHNALHSKLMIAEQSAASLKQEVRRTHERAAEEISLREAAFKKAEQYAKTLEAELFALRKLMSIDFGR